MSGLNKVPNMSNQKFFDVMVKQLCSQIVDGDHYLTELPKTVRIVLGENQWKTPMWRERQDKDKGEVYTFDRFEDFVETPPTAGLGATIRMLKHICRDDPVALDMIDRAAQRPAHRPAGSRVIHPTFQEGEKLQDRSTKHLRRLRQDHPDLHERVLTGEMTVTEAAVQAGVYPKRIAINLQSPASAAATIRNNSSPEFIAQLINELTGNQDA